MVTREHEEGVTLVVTQVTLLGIALPGVYLSTGAANKGGSLTWDNQDLVQDTSQWGGPIQGKNRRG